MAAGEFTVYDETTGAVFKTFCIEHNETIYSWEDVVINSISNAAVRGGISGGNPDPLSGQTAYLFYNFWNGTLSGYNSTKEDVLQIAIWMLEGEVISGDDTGLWNANNEYYKLAPQNGWSDIGPVRVINPVLYSENGQIREYKQSLLFVTTPEPGTLLLMGLGLVGLAGLRRKK